jgi:hypothetical protein
MSETKKLLKGITGSIATGTTLAVGGIIGGQLGSPGIGNAMAMGGSIPMLQMSGTTLKALKHLGGK